MKLLNPNSILSRLLLTFLLVVIPVVAIGIVMIIWEKHAIQLQIEESAMDNVSFLQANFENEIENINLLQYNLLGDNALNELVLQYGTLGTSEFYSRIRNVRQRLQVVVNSSNYIENVTVFMPGMGHLISVKDGFLPINETEYNRFYQAQLGRKYPIVIDETGIYVTSLYPFRADVEEPPLYFVKADLSVNKIKGYLGKFNKYKTSNTALYNYTSGSWILSSQSSIDAAMLEEARIVSPDNAGLRHINSEANLLGQQFYVASAYSEYLNISFLHFIPMEAIFRVPNQYSKFLWMYGLLSVAVMLVYLFSINRLVRYPINALLRAFRKVEDGDLGARLQLKAAEEFKDAFRGFNNMAQRLSGLIDKVYKQELYAKKTELKQLQSQINPHFLYNSFFMLRRMIKRRDMEGAEQLSSHLGYYFQYITRNASDEVPLRNELEHMRSYMEIQQLRFAERFSMEIGDLPGEYGSLPVPRIILQPIVENAIEHGLKTELKDGTVKVHFTPMDNGLIISVEDSGSQLGEADLLLLQDKLLSKEEQMETTGIINVHRRIQLRYERGSGIAVSRSGLGGLKVELRIINTSS
ncbi:MAG: signal transduction histidine kinase LytS [Paenibacillaceae bacterium]|nr:signal transduction histidine kinase LytS [Paenibacillaceae bacterium]